jgi:hypothetical protein
LSNNDTKIAQFGSGMRKVFGDRYMFDNGGGFEASSQERSRRHVYKMENLPGPQH